MGFSDLSRQGKRQGWACLEVENLQFAQGIGLGIFAECFPFVIFETIVWSTAGVYVSIYLPIIINEDTAKLIIVRLCLPLLNNVSLSGTYDTGSFQRLYLHHPI